MESTPLSRVADERIRRMDPPEGATVFLHGDVWPGNVVWLGENSCVLIDWKMAGVGHPGVDRWELRKQMAVYYGLGRSMTLLMGGSRPVVGRRRIWPIRT